MATQPSAPSLRFQIIASLGTLLVLSFLPLFFAVASLSRATALGVVNDEMALRAHVLTLALGDAREANALGAALGDQAKEPQVLALAVSDKDSRVLLGATPGLPPEWEEAAGSAALAAVRSTSTSTSTSAPTKPRGGFAEYAEDSGRTHVHVRFRAESVESRVAPLLRLTALYILLFGAALLAFAYLALTRLIVRPIDVLSREAERVASGARTFRVPQMGPRETAELGASLRAMTDNLVASEKSLKRKVTELTQATERLTEAQTQLVRSERLAGVGKLAAGVAHEIGNPIAAILGMLDLVSDPDIAEEDRRDLLARTQKETERISGIVKDLLDFARPEKSAESSASLEVAVSTVDRVVRDVVSLVSTQKNWKSIVVTTDVTPALTVTLPEARLSQVLLNLLLNAGHALAETDGATISIVAKERADGRVTITVADNGPGVPAHARAQIFEPFFTTKDVGEGTGLGLSVCRGLVEAVGGDISLDLGHEGGASFRVTLPKGAT